MSKITAADLPAIQARLATNRNPAAAAAADTAKREKFARGQEKELSRQFCAYLTQKGVPHIVARTDRKSTVREGWPDVTAMMGVCDQNGLTMPLVCCVELKCEGGICSGPQILCHAELMNAGIPVLVAYSLQEAIAFVREHLHL